MWITWSAETYFRMSAVFYKKEKKKKKKKNNNLFENVVLSIVFWGMTVNKTVPIGDTFGKHFFFRSCSVKRLSGIAVQATYRF